MQKMLKWKNKIIIISQSKDEKKTPLDFPKKRLQLH
jgi:hypothetical protein